MPLEELEELLDELELDEVEELEPELDEFEIPMATALKVTQNAGEPHADNEMRQIERTKPETKRKNFFGIDTPLHTHPLCFNEHTLYLYIIVRRKV